MAQKNKRIILNIIQIFLENKTSLEFNLELPFSVYFFMDTLSVPNHLRHTKDCKANEITSYFH